MNETTHSGDDRSPGIGGLSLVSSYKLAALRDRYEQSKGDTLGTGQLASLAQVYAEEQAIMDYLDAAAFGIDAEAEALRAVRDWVHGHGGPDHAEDI